MTPTREEMLMEVINAIACGRGQSLEEAIETMVRLSLLMAYRIKELRKSKTEFDATFNTSPG